MTFISPETLKVLLESLHEQYGYDFTAYAEASMMRRVERVAHQAGGISLDELSRRLLSDASFFGWFLETVTVNVTEMFRDPGFYLKLREQVITVLSTYPTINIWHAGCSTGEEVYSFAILLEEAGLLERTRIYATDINPANLEKAKAGVMPIAVMRDYTANYRRSGGVKDFSEYYTARYNRAIIHKDLRDKIVFLQHNLVTDGVFNSFQLVLCRNVLIYFQRPLQNRVLRLLHDSLVPLGFLALGSKETLHFSELRDRFSVVANTHKIFRRIA